MDLLGFRYLFLGCASCFLMAGCSSPQPKDAPKAPPSTKAPGGQKNPSQKEASGAELGEKGVFPGGGDEGEGQ